MQDVLFSREGSMYIICLNRPQQRNAMNIAMLQEINAQLDEIREDQDIHTVIFTGAGDVAFCSGDELDEVADKTMQIITITEQLLQKVALYPKVTIAAINGLAHGGGAELAVSCDLRIASENVTFRWTGVKIGQTVGVVSLARIVGPSLAKSILLTTKLINAHEALDRGIITELVSGNQLWETVCKRAEELAAIPQASVAHLKQLAYSTLTVPLEQAYEEEFSAITFCAQDPQVQALMNDYRNHIKNRQK